MSFFPILYITLLITLLLLKKLRIQWRRFRILHFSIHKIDQMSGEAFEAYLYEQFVRLGFKVTTTNVSGDYGADLILQKKKLVIALQAKRYQGKIGVKAIQEVLGSMAYYEADKGLVVTNSTYTRNAEKLAEVNHVLLWDRDVLIRLIAGENMSTYLSELLKNDF
ncbi:MAG: restriction system protein [Clostridiales bacterium]|nr:restriction system protein [Clostridiales bacterium]